MIRHFIALAVICTVLNVATGAAGQPADDGTTLERIEAAYQLGQIDDEQYVLYRLYRVVDKERLSAELVAPAGTERPVRCGTPMVRHARQATAWLSPGGLSIIEELLPERSATRSTTHTSDNFALVAGDDYTGEQSDIDFWLDAFETSWDVEVGQLGFDAPPCTEMMLFYVYLANTGPDVPDLEDDVYGYCDHDYSDCPFVVVHPDYSFASNPDGAAQATAAHEFQHGIQSGYDWFEGDSWMEATATWAEDVVFDDANDYVEYLNGDEGWLAYPELSLTYEDGWHEYGNVIWAKYLSENWGGDEVIVDVWDRCRDTDMLSAVDGMMAAQGSSLDEGFHDFMARLAVGDFEEADLYDDVYRMAEITGYPHSGAPPQYLPRQYGSNYLAFYPEGETDTLYIEFDGAEKDGGQDVTWGLTLVEVSGSTYSYEILDVDGAGDASASVADFGESVDQVILGITVLDGDSDSTAGVEYSYAADIGSKPVGDDDDGQGAGDDEGGCGCRAEGDTAAPTLPVALLALAALFRRR